MNDNLENIPHKFKEGILRFEIEIEHTPHDKFGSITALTDIINKLVLFLDANIEPVPPFFQHKETEIDKFKWLVEDLGRSGMPVVERIYNIKKATVSLLGDLLERLDKGVVILCKPM